MKKLQNLGKLLTKNEQVKIKGGPVDPDEGTCGAQCNLTCTVTCNGQTINGTCGINPHNGKCYCSGAC